MPICLSLYLSFYIPRALTKDRVLEDLLVDVGDDQTAVADVNVPTNRANSQTWARDLYHFLNIFGFFKYKPTFCKFFMKFQI